MLVAIPPGADPRGRWLVRARSTARAFTRARVGSPSTWWSSRFPRAWVDDDGSLLVYDWAGASQSPSARRSPNGELERIGSGWIIATLIYSGLGLFVAGLSFHAALSPFRSPDSWFAFAFGAGFLWFATLPLQRWSKIRQLVADYDAGTALALEPADDAPTHYTKCAVMIDLDADTSAVILRDLGLRFAEELDPLLLRAQCQLFGVDPNGAQIAPDGTSFAIGDRTWIRWCAAGTPHGTTLIIDDGDPNGLPSGIVWITDERGNPAPTPDSVARIMDALTRIHPLLGSTGIALALG